MDLTKRPVHWEQSPEQWLRAANVYMPPIVTAGLVLAIACQLSTLTWELLATFAPSVPTFVARADPPTRQRPVSTSFATLEKSRLFGEVSEEPAPIRETVVEAPNTTLSLLLMGIVARDGDPNGQAIISGARGQEDIHVGQAIEDASGATLHSVYADRVLLDHGGRLETLSFSKEVASGGAVRRAPSRPSEPAAAEASPDSLRSVLARKAVELAQILQPKPNLQQGKVAGFRVNPGRDREGFEALGFVPGDIVTDINGIVLDDLNRGLQAFEALGEATMANVTVLRDGSTQVLVIDTRQLQNLQPKPQP